MSIVDRFTVADFHEMALTVRTAGLGARGQAIYALLLGLALETEQRTEYHATQELDRAAAADATAYDEAHEEAA